MIPYAIRFATLLTVLALLTSVSESFAQRRFPYRFDLNSRSLDTLHTPDPTSPDHRYRITAWGTYSMWEDTVNSSVDPIWIYSFPDEEWAKPEWRLFPEGYPIYVGDSRMLNSHGLRINDAPYPQQSLNSEHRYTTIIQGNGKPVSAMIVDWNFRDFIKRDAHDNNSGWLHVLVEELPNTSMDICAIDSSQFPKIRLSLQVHRDSVRYEDFYEKLLIRENGVAVKIDSIDCSVRTAPVSIAMVFDRSGSMQEPFGSSTRMAETRIAGKRFVDRLAAFDEAAIYSFSLTTTLNQNWTSSKPLMKSAIDGLQPDGWTAMNDAIIRAIDDIERRPTDRPKAVVVLSDGEDNRSAVKSIRTVAERAKRAGVPVYALGLLLESDDSLRLLTSLTGGRYFSISDPSAMDSAFASIADVVFEKGCCSVYYTSPDARRNGSYRGVSAAVAFERDTLLEQGIGYRAPGTSSSVETADASVQTTTVSVSPNPLRDGASLSLHLAQGGNVRATLIDVSGREVAMLVDEYVPAGDYTQSVNLGGIAPGRYFVRVVLPGEVVLYPVMVER
jgi:VWFA-related protein